MYMDNLSVHNASSVKSHFNDRIQQRFLPPYSCSLNPIERLWNVAKQKWRRMMVEKPELVQTDEDLVNEVKKLIEGTKDQCSSLANSHLQHMLRSLRGDFV